MMFAHTYQMGLCGDPACRAIHVHLLDEQGRTFATMTIAVESVPEVVAELQAFSYEIVTRQS